MKVMKKIFVVLLAGALVFELAACSNGNNSSKELSNNTEQTKEESKSDTSKTDEKDKADTSKVDEKTKTDTSKTEEKTKTDTTKTDEQKKTDNSKTEKKDTTTVPKTHSDPASKTYPFSGTTWVKQDNSTYKFVFDETTYNFSFKGMAIKNMEYEVEKNGEGYIAKTKMNKTTMTVNSADATTATVFRTEVDMTTHAETDITETYIRQ